jgi:hypothetical protein
MGSVMPLFSEYPDLSSYSLTVTKHAREQWRARVNQNVSDQEVDQQILDNLAKAVYVWDDPDGTSCYIDKDHWVFYVNMSKKTVVTIVEVDFGFPKDLNRNTARDLMVKITQKRAAINKLAAKQEETRFQIQDRKQQINDQIEILQTEYNKLSNSLDSLDCDMEIQQKELASLAYMLTYSKNYKVDLLTNLKK